MRKISILFGLVLCVSLIAWVLMADFGGYTSRSAMIIARSTPIVSTMAGEVTYMAASAGSKVTAGSLLATVRNNRIDRSHLTELLATKTFLEQEIITTESQNTELRDRQNRLAGLATTYRRWAQQDLNILHEQKQYQLRAAEETYATKKIDLERQERLLKGSGISNVVRDLARSDVTIALNKMEALRAELARIELQITASNESGAMFREDGDTNYWEQSSDATALRLLDNRRQIAAMRAQLTQLDQQIDAENERLQTSYIEQHIAQFDGIVNAVLISKDELVTAGTTLMEVLDCANPIAIVSIPDYRVGDFFIGQKAVIRPVDSNSLIAGVIQHISSGSLISRDTTIAAYPELMFAGNKAIIALENNGQKLNDLNAPAASCDTARRAVVTIETNTAMDKFGDMLAGLFDHLPLDVQAEH
jgi:multidrug resistance efflux pump